MWENERRAGISFMLNPSSTARCISQLFPEMKIDSTRLASGPRRRARAYASRREKDGVGKSGRRIVRSIGRYAEFSNAMAVRTKISLGSASAVDLGLTQCLSMTIDVHKNGVLLTRILQW